VLSDDASKHEKRDRNNPESLKDFKMENSLLNQVWVLKYLVFLAKFNYKTVILRAINKQEKERIINSLTKLCFFLLFKYKRPQTILNHSAYSTKLEINWFLVSDVC